MRCGVSWYLGVKQCRAEQRGKLLVNWSQGNKINFYISPSLTKFYSIDYTGSNKEFVSLTSRYKVKLSQNKKYLLDVPHARLWGVMIPPDPNVTRIQISNKDKSVSGCYGPGAPLIAMIITRL